MAGIGMLSIIIVSYKVPDLLIQCIDALKKTDDGHIHEIIVVDNDSGDDSAARVRTTHPDVQWIQNDSNLGFAAAVNIGLTASHGDAILLLNPDTIMTGSALSSIARFWRNNPETGIIGGKIINADHSFQKQCRRRFPNPVSACFRLFGLTRLFPHHPLSVSYEMGNENIDTACEVDAVSGACMSFPRQLISEIGMFDEGYFLMGEDLDFCFRAKLAGYTIRYIPDAEVIHHHGASRKRRPIRSLYYGHIAMARFYRKFLSERYSRFMDIVVYLGILVRFLGLSSACMIQTMIKGR
ncbi:glycosyltransferase family 2 protein [bacterium]|nr:glycosyltransferase family 2 protein [candidate division CSSED10-310 bacterium]